MTYWYLPVSDEPRHIFLLDLAPDGIALQARVEVRYLAAPDIWVISIWDHSTDELLVNQIPLICSYGELNDLLEPFRCMRNGAGLGSLFVLNNTDIPDTQDPAEKTLGQFIVLWGDKFDLEQL